MTRIVLGRWWAIGFGLVLTIGQAVAAEPQAPVASPPSGSRIGELLAQATPGPTAPTGESSMAGANAPAPTPPPPPTPEDFNPNMIGDSLGGACATAMFTGVITAQVDHPTFFCNQIKIAENNSPIPQDRVYLTYQRFDRATALSITDSVTLQTAQANLSIVRYTLGVEKTFLDGLVSAELRVPINTELSNTLVFDVDTNQFTQGTVTQIGNIAVALKALLYDCKPFHFSGGLLIHTPTTPDVTIHDVETDFSPAIQLLNNTYRFRYQSLLLSPFLGAVVNPGHRCFAQGFLEFDFDPTGSAIDVDRQFNGIDLAPLSFRLHQQDLMRADVGAGYWLYRATDKNGITGVAPTIEMHYTTTLNDAKLIHFDRAPDNPIVAGNVANRIDIVNLLLGTTVEVANCSTLAVAAVIPLSTGDNKPFAWEFNLQLNYRFGARFQQIYN